MAVPSPGTCPRKRGPRVLESRALLRAKGARLVHPGHGPVRPLE
ncbi:MAG: hypothetical protein ABDH20_07005 [Thermus sp.]